MRTVLTETKAEFMEYVDAMNIATLRCVGRMYGIARVSTCTKAQIKIMLLHILMGKQPPAPKSRRGAPVKNESVDPKIVEDIERFRQRLADAAALPEEEKPMLTVCEPRPA